jgi:hypothetical protein
MIETFYYNSYVLQAKKTKNEERLFKGGACWRGRMHTLHLIILYCLQKYEKEKVFDQPMKRRRWNLQMFWKFWYLYSNIKPQVLENIIRNSHNKKKRKIWNFL